MGKVGTGTKTKQCHLGLGHFRGGGAAGTSAHFQGQVGHAASLLYELVEAAQAAQLHHNGQRHTTHVCLYGLQDDSLAYYNSVLTAGSRACHPTHVCLYGLQSITSAFDSFCPESRGFVPHAVQTHVLMQLVFPKLHGKDCCGILPFC